MDTVTRLDDRREERHGGTPAPFDPRPSHGRRDRWILLAAVAAPVATAAVLTPTPGAPVPRQRLLVAVTVADQVGTALAADHAIPGPRA